MAYIISVAILPPLYTDLEESKFLTLLIIQILDTMHNSMKKNNTLPSRVTNIFSHHYLKYIRNMETCSYGPAWFSTKICHRPNILQQNFGQYKSMC